MEKKVLTVNFGEINVVFPRDLSSSEAFIMGYVNDEECNDILYAPEEVSTVAQQQEEGERILALLRKLYDGKDLEKHLNNIATKKNGKFRKNSTSVIDCLEYSTHYFTDYTNAWDTIRIFMKAISEKEVCLEVQRTTITN
jgi:hypothetical protein